MFFLAIFVVILFRSVMYLNYFLQDPENSFMDGMQIEDIGKWHQAHKAVNPNPHHLSITANAIFPILCSNFLEVSSQHTCCVNQTLQEL